jgi:hypothetical protein
MNKHAINFSNIDLSNHRWIVEFSFRFADDHQRSVVKELGIQAHHAVRLWIDVLTPGACVMEPVGTPIKYVAFLSRSAARRFVKSWGGKLVAQPSEHVASA